MKRAKNQKQKTKPPPRHRRSPPVARVLGTKTVGFGKHKIGKHKKCKEEKTHPPSRREAEYVRGRFLIFLKESKGKRDVKTSPSNTAVKRRAHRKKEYKKARDTMARSRAFRLSEGIKKYKYRLFCK